MREHEAIIGISGVHLSLRQTRIGGDMVEEVYRTDWSSMADVGSGRISALCAVIEHGRVVRGSVMRGAAEGHGMRVFLDDERNTPDGWVRVYWPDEAIALLESGTVTELSLDGP